LVGDGGWTRDAGIGVKSNNWSLKGNYDSNPDDPDYHRLGTTDAIDFAIVTTNEERIRVLANGDVNIENSLQVKKNVNLNTTEGETINYGPFTVHNQSPTLLSGTLVVDEETDLNSSLNVDGPTYLNSSLDVDSFTILNSTLRTKKDATFNQHVYLNHPATGDDTTEYLSLSTTTGALVVTGGVGMGGNLNVGGKAAFGGPVEFGDRVRLTATYGSTSPSTGTLIVGGGAGIGENLYVGGLGDITGNMNIGGNLYLDGTFELINAGGEGYVATFENESNGNGISIQVGAAVPHNNNQFITFLNSAGEQVGAIIGENGPDDLANNGDYQQELAFKITDLAISGTDLIISGVAIIQSVLELFASTTSSTFCAGVGACVTSPIPSFIVSSGAKVIVEAANLVLIIVDVAQVATDLGLFVTRYEASFGVTYESGGSDYAEYLPKYDVNEIFWKGAVVGMKNGLITMNTKDADRIMVISHKPVVLGGMPADGNKDAYEMVAFMGQVPTHIMGPAEPGDYILANGFHNGFGVARNPNDMRPNDYKNVLGVAWEGAKGMKANIVNVAVGLNTNDMADLVVQQAKDTKAQQEEIKSLENQLKETNAILAQLVPGFKEAAGIKDEIKEGPAVSVKKSVEEQVTPEYASDSDHEHDPNGRTSEDDIVYYQVSEDELEASFALARKAFIEAGVDLSEHPFWQRIDTEPDYKEEVKQDMRKKLEFAMHTHKTINQELDRN
jgi:hypothetical protein